MRTQETQQLSKKEILSKFIQINPFATIMLGGKDLLTTYSPVLGANKGDEIVLYGHIAKDNPQYKYLENGKSALIIFECKDPCISALSNEPIIEEYSAVHINGKMTLQSEEELKISLSDTFKLLRKYYNYSEEEYPITKEIIEKQLDLVTGFYCKPSLINPILKLRQSF